MPLSPRSHASRLSHGRRASDARYAEHRAADPALALAERLRHTAAWRRFRAAYLSSHPLCEDPFDAHAHSGRAVPSAEIHHLQPLRLHPSGLCDPDNVLALCIPCHAALEPRPRLNEAAPGQAIIPST